MQKTLKISFRQAKKICFPREQSRAIMTLLLQIKYIKYVFFPVYANLHGQYYTLLTLSKRCMVGKEFSNTSIVYKLTQKIMCFTFIC